MKRIFLIASSVLLLAGTSFAARPYRYIHNCDGTDLLGNFWNNKRPLSVADINAYVDVLSNEGVTTLMVCSGSDFANYRSKYGRMIGDNLDGALDTRGDTMVLNYYRNAKLVEAEGTDCLRAFMTETKKNGKEAFITYRMNDLHSCDVNRPSPVWVSDFWGAHPEYYVKDTGHGWNREGALDFSYPEVRQQKINMLCEQLDMYGDIMDGLEMDFTRFIVYFPLGQGAANKEKMTDLVRTVRAKVDAVNRASGRHILLTARVPDTWLSCIYNGLDVNEWVREGLVDFLNLAVHWKGDPAVDTDAFRAEAGIGNRIPVYVTLDDGSFWPREFYSHSEMRGAASFAYSHGADGICLFNYFFGPYFGNGGKIEVRNGIVSQMICPELMHDLSSAAALEGLNKTYSYYSGNAEYAMSYKSPMPLHPSKGCSEEITFFIADKMKTSVPQRGLIFYRTSKGSDIHVTFNGTVLGHTSEDAALPTLFCKTDKPDGGEFGCYIVPADLLHYGANNVVVSTDAVGVTVSKFELTLDYGDVAEHGYF